MLATACSAGSATQPTASPTAEPALHAINYMVVPAPSLANNLLGEPAEHGVRVYLPPQYFESDQLMRTIYYLPNQGDSTIHNTDIPRVFDEAFKTVGPMIVVVISGRNRYNGSFWVDSPVTGDWGTFIAHDVVDYIDSHFRTIPKPEARGIAGHAMGGYGALDIALKHPEVFGSAFAFAPWVLAAAGPDEGLSYPPDRIETIVDLLESVQGMTAEETLAAYDRMPTVVASTRTGIDIAYGMAFAPLTQPPFFEYPYRRVDGVIVRDDAVMAKWTRGVGGTTGDAVHDTALWGALDAIGIDCASNREWEWFVNGCTYLDARLTELGIAHDFWPDDGHYGDHIPSHAVEVMLPFFDEHLSSS